MKVLTFSNLFPNSIQTTRGIFIKSRLKNLCKRHSDVEVRVVAPVPWFPFNHRIFGGYSDSSKIERQANHGWAQVQYVRYISIPKIGMNIAPWLMAIACYPKIRKIIKEGFDFDVLDAHYFYPDGVAAMMLARWLGKPLICSARGSDITLLPRYPVPRRLIGKAVQSCDTVVTVSRALKTEIEVLGYNAKRIEVLRNGVDLEMFRPADDRSDLKRRLGMEEFTILSVGNLLELKGHHLTIAAMQSLPDCKLLIAGDGPWKKKLYELAENLGVDDRVQFLGTVEHRELPDLYAAADLMVLASSREGWANVLLESMACGTPVVATNIWGTPEVVASEQAGILVERTPEAILEGINHLRNALPDRSKTRNYALQFSWDDTSDRLYEILQQVPKTGSAQLPPGEPPFQ